MAPAASTEQGHRRFAVGPLLLVASLTLLFGADLLAHARVAIDPWHFNDDVRQQIWPLLRYADPDLFPADYIADYFLANLPPGHRVLYGATTPFIDPRVLSKVLPYAGLLVILYAVVAASWRLAGPVAACASGALCLSTTVFLARMAGGLPRGFGFPLVALTVLALVRGKGGRLCILTVLGAAFYYPVGLTLGLVTALHLLVLPTSWQGGSRDWSAPRRLGALTVTAVVAILLTLPSLVALRPFGPLIGFGDLAAYPEAGPGGRYSAADLPTEGAFVRVVQQEVDATLLSRKPSGYPQPDAQSPPSAWSTALRLSYALPFGVGFGLLLMAQVSARRLLSLVLAPCILYPLALALWPRLYLPARYVTYVVPVLAVVLLPAAVTALLQRLRPMRSVPVASVTVAAGVIALVTFHLNAQQPGETGVAVRIAAWERPLYQFVARLPPDAMIAGWPGGPIENVPYLSGRKILHGFEVHQAFHKAYVEEMRRRMNALIDAYFATDVAPLLRLRREFGVTHLLVNRAHYDNAAPSYFAPFEAKIVRARHEARGQPVALGRNPAVVFEARWLALLDLDRLAQSAEGIDSGSVSVQ